LLFSGTGVGVELQFPVALVYTRLLIVIRPDTLVLFSCAYRKQYTPAYPVLNYLTVGDIRGSEGDEYAIVVF
jgi:hypothetical protein